MKDIALIGRDPRVCHTQLNDNEIVILNPVDENFYHLNETAVDLWLSLETPKTLQELAQILAVKYSGHSESYCNDVIEWIDDNKQKGLLTVVDGANVATNA